MQILDKTDIELFWYLVSKTPKGLLDPHSIYCRLQFSGDYRVRRSPTLTILGRFDCECGKTVWLSIKRVRSGLVRSCGCLRKEHSLQIHKSIQKYPEGTCYSRLYRIWSKIKARCYDTSQKGYHNYGGRGIVMCQEWLQDFMSFHSWATSSGYGDTLSIDRIDNDGNYEPLNCRWISLKAQHRNKRTNHLITAFGETKCIAEWADDPRCSVDHRVLGMRFQRMDPEKAILAPKSRGGVPLQSQGP
jgi:hypothetical protein